MNEEATPLLLQQHNRSTLTLVYRTHVTTVPFTEDFHQPPNTVAVITTPAPKPALLQQLSLPTLPSPAYPRLQALQNGYTLAMPSLTTTTNSNIVLVVTKTKLPTFPPGAAVHQILALIAISTIPTFLRAVDSLADALDLLEASSLTQKHTTEVKQIWRIRRQVSRLRRHGIALRHVLRALSVSESTIRTLQIGIDTLSLIRDSAHGALELLLALQNNRMQETMQTLAVVTTIFVPLTFLAGIEGMNFVNQPELSWGWSYAAFWAVVLLLIIGQIVFFRRKGWI